MIRQRKIVNSDMAENLSIESMNLRKVWQPALFSWLESKLDIWLLQKTAFLGRDFLIISINFLKMPKSTYFERIFQSGNTVSFRLIGGEKSRHSFDSQKFYFFVRVLMSLWCTPIWYQYFQNQYQSFSHVGLLHSNAI